MIAFNRAHRVNGTRPAQLMQSVPADCLPTSIAALSPKPVISLDNLLVEQRIGGAPVLDTRGTLVFARR